VFVRVFLPGTILFFLDILKVWVIPSFQTVVLKVWFLG
jgi:hypothetical protein